MSEIATVDFVPPTATAAYAELQQWAQRRREARVAAARATPPAPPATTPSVPTVPMPDGRGRCLASGNTLVFEDGSMMSSSPFAVGAVIFEPMDAQQRLRRRIWFYTLAAERLSYHADRLQQALSRGYSWTGAESFRETFPGVEVTVEAMQRAATAEAAKARRLQAELKGDLR